MGRLNMDAWRRIGAPDHILNWVKDGVKINFISEPIPGDMGNCVKNGVEEKFVDEQVEKCTEDEAVCILPIKCIPKKNQKLRLVVDCRYVNNYVVAPKFKQEGIEMVAEQIQAGDLLITVDLQDGFHFVNLHKSCQKYFGMRWKGKCYIWQELPFGCLASPYFFKKILKPVTKYLGDKLHLRIALFVTIQMSQPQCATGNRDMLLATLEELSWCVNYEKS